jgi:hypothetical protein
MKKNLDCMDQTELQSVTVDPDQPDAYRVYASRKLLAVRARLEGQIPLAMVMEGECDRIYESMPRDLRW